MDLSSNPTAALRPRWSSAVRDLLAAVGFAALATLARAALQPVSPNLAPFAFMFPAVLAATLAASWLAGVLCLVLSLAAAWWLFLQPAYGFLPLSRANALNLLLVGVSAGAVILVAELHGRARRRIRQLKSAAALERERTLTGQLGLLDNATSFMAVLSGPELRVAYANAAYLRLVRRTSAIIGQPLADARPEADPEFIRLIREVMRTGQPYAAEGAEWSIAPDDVRYLDFIYEPVRDVDGQVASVLVEGYDVTEIVRGRRALEASESRLRLAAEAGKVGVWEWRLDTNEMIYSPEAKAICGFPADQPVTFEMVVAATHPDDYPRTSAQADRALDPARRESADYEYRIVRPDGAIRWVTARGQAVFESNGEAEVATRYLGTLVDITEHKLAEESMRESQQGLALALKAGRMAVWQADARGRVAPSPAINAMIGLPPDARPTMDELAPNYLPGELERIRAEGARARAAGERHFEVEYGYRLPTGEVRWFNARLEATFDAAGASTGAIGIVMDVTERKLAEERLQLLTREVDHRANNLMSVIQSTVAMSRAATADELRDIIIGRVHALARAHQLLSATRWEGADLRRLIEEELLPFTFGGAERVTLRGPEVSIGPAAAQSIAMALHELATNAAKHGALSCSAGRVEVAWDLSEETLRLTWSESGGPRVRPPRRRGFGTNVLARALGGPLGGSTELEWAPSGLVCHMRLPLAGRTGLAPVAAA